MAKFNDVREELLRHIRDGCTFKEACQYVGVSESQFYDWKAKNLEFSDAVKAAQKEARQKLVPQLEEALIKRACGFEVEERRTEYFSNGDKKDTIIRKSYPPDTASLIFALCNLSPDVWRNKVEQKVEGDLRTTVKVEVDDKDTMKEINKLGE